MLNRRQALQLGISIAAYSALGLKAEESSAGPLITRPIPSSGEAVPVIGMGTSRTFDTGDDALVDVRLAGFAAGSLNVDVDQLLAVAPESVVEAVDSKLEHRREQQYTNRQHECERRDFMTAAVLHS